MNKKTITVFGSSLPAEGDEEFETALQLGRLLAQKNFNICTGGYRGIMIGVTVDLWNVKPNKYLTKEIKCDSLFERISKLIETGDAYVILQGGTGTLLELSVVWELMNKNLLKRKPVVCYSQMWKEIVLIMERQIEKGNRQTGLIKPCENINAMVDYLCESLK